MKMKSITKYYNNHYYHTEKHIIRSSSNAQQVSDITERKLLQISMTKRSASGAEYAEITSEKQERVF